MIILEINYPINSAVNTQNLTYSIHKIHNNEVDYTNFDTDNFKFIFPKQILSIYSQNKDDGQFHLFPAAESSPKNVTFDIVFSVLIQKDYGLEQRYSFYSIDNSIAISNLATNNSTEKDLVELFAIFAKIDKANTNTKNEVSFTLEKASVQK